MLRRGVCCCTNLLTASFSSLPTPHRRCALHQRTQATLLHAQLLLQHLLDLVLLSGVRWVVQWAVLATMGPV